MEKINIAELLKDYPKGTKLYSPLCGECEFDHIEYMGKIVCQTKKYTTIWFLPTGVYFEGYSGAECVLFPSKENRDWSKFQRPFKDGDIVFYNDTITIFKEWGDETLFRTYVTKYLHCDSLIDMNVPLFGKGVRKEVRFATEEEKEKLFQAIKDNGYRWNDEAKTLEKLPKFKVGDKIKYKNGKNIDGVERGVILSITDDTYDVAVTNDMGIFVSIADQDDWELVLDIKPKFKVGDRIKYRNGEIVYHVIQITEDTYVLDNLCSIPISMEHMYNLVSKFDITTLKPFESTVLVRDIDTDKWRGAFYSHYDSKKFYTIGSSHYYQCIPYKGNEYLLSTTNDCDEYFKNW